MLNFLIILLFFLISFSGFWRTAFGTEFAVVSSATAVFTSPTSFNRGWLLFILDFFRSGFSFYFHFIFISRSWFFHDFLSRGDNFWFSGLFLFRGFDFARASVGYKNKAFLRGVPGYNARYAFIAPCQR